MNKNTQRGNCVLEKCMYCLFFEDAIASVKWEIKILLTKKCWDTFPFRYWDLKWLQPRGWGYMVKNYDYFSIKFKDFTQFFG